MDGYYATKIINNRYGMDFTDDLDGFENLIGLARAGKEIRYCAYYLYRLKGITQEMLEVLWGEEVHNMLQRCFMDIYRRYKVAKKNKKRSAYCHQAVLQSWLYRWVEQRRNEGDPILNKRVKKAFLNATMNI